jgi:hypothetical protein
MVILNAAATMKLTPCKTSQRSIVVIRPIALQDLMADPVILCQTGVSYERSSIEAWISRSGCARRKASTRSPPWLNASLPEAARHSLVTRSSFCQQSLLRRPSLQSGFFTILLALNRANLR